MRGSGSPFSSTSRIRPTFRGRLTLNYRRHFGLGGTQLSSVRTSAMLTTLRARGRWDGGGNKWGFVRCLRCNKNFQHFQQIQSHFNDYVWSGFERGQTLMPSPAAPSSDYTNTLAPLRKTMHQVKTLKSISNQLSV